jgi:hypothetical protein
MADILPELPDDLFDFDLMGIDAATAWSIAGKIGEMIDRVKVADKIVPGAVASWVIEVDGKRFQVAIKRERSDAARSPD